MKQARNQPTYYFAFLKSPLGLGYQFWKLQARTVKIEYRQLREQKDQLTN